MAELKLKRSRCECTDDVTRMEMAHYRPVFDKRATCQLLAIDSQR